MSKSKVGRTMQEVTIRGRWRCCSPRRSSRRSRRPAQSTTETTAGRSVARYDTERPAAGRHGRGGDQRRHRASRTAATTRDDGFFNIAVAPGRYTVTATLPSFGTRDEKVRVLVGQTATLDFELRQPRGHREP